ncbi:hypothetical protein D047_0614A, partial [Vibrio parahaemolyticus VPTS-2010_2]
MLQRR